MVDAADVTSKEGTFEISRPSMLFALVVKAVEVAVIDGLGGMEATRR
jgi:hypothetical protein